MRPDVGPIRLELLVRVILVVDHELLDILKVLLVPNLLSKLVGVVLANVDLFFAVLLSRLAVFPDGSFHEGISTFLTIELVWQSTVVLLD